MTAKHLDSELKFVECANCVNLDLDPWICRYCKKASNFEPEQTDTDEALEYHEFVDMVRRGDFDNE